MSGNDTKVIETFFFDYSLKPAKKSLLLVLINTMNI